MHQDAGLPPPMPSRRGTGSEEVVSTPGRTRYPSPSRALFGSFKNAFSASSLWYTQDTSGDLSRSPTNAKVFMFRLQLCTCSAQETLCTVQDAGLTCFQDTIVRIRQAEGQGYWLQKGTNTGTSSFDTSFLLSSTLTLLRRKTQPGFTSGCATYTLNLEHGRTC